MVDYHHMMIVSNYATERNLVVERDAAAAADAGKA